MSSQRYSPVPRLWRSATVAIIGGGPSLTEGDVRRLRDQMPVIAINDALRLAPWADVHYFCDRKWHAWHKDKPWYQAFRGLRITLENHHIDESMLIHLRNTGRDGLEVSKSGVRTGRNGGYQCINVGVHMGASRIILLGFDMHAEDNGKRTHWFGTHPVRTDPSIYANMLRCFATIVDPLRKAGVEVYNCTPGSSLSVFKRTTLDEMLQRGPI